MKFTLTQNDNLKFKIVSYSNISADEILIKNTRVYRDFDYWRHQSRDVDENNCRFDNIWITIYKGIGKIAYRLEDLQLICHGKCNKRRVYKIEVNANVGTRKAKVKVFAEKSYSCNDYFQDWASSSFEYFLIQIRKVTRKITKKKKEANRAIKNIIKEKSKKTITDEY